MRFMLGVLSEIRPPEPFEDESVSDSPLSFSQFSERVGEVAGLVWHYLDAHDHASTAELKFNLLLSNKEMYCAIGWLLREEKVEVMPIDTGLMVQLKRITS